MNASNTLFRFLALVFVGATAPAISSPGSDDQWAFISDDLTSYRVEPSVNAQNGEHLMVIDGTVLKYPIEYQQQGGYWQRPFRPSGYLYQSINAKPYISKHLHISGFARAIKPNFAELEKQFTDYYEGAEQARLSVFLNDYRAADKPVATERFNEDYSGYYQEKLLEFKEFIRTSNENSQYGIAVFLDMGEGNWNRRDIRAHGPTSLGAQRLNELWNRFNVEVSIPKGCQSISIVLWQQGVAISEFDHLAVSEQGDAIDTNISNFRLNADTLVKKIIENHDLTAGFSNLSFE